MKEQETLEQESVEKSAPAVDSEVENNVVATDNSEELAKSAAEVKELKELVKSLAAQLDEQIAKAEDEKLLAVAKKYELLGTPTDKLVKMFKAAKAVDMETYNAAIESLDIMLDKHAVLYAEIGKSGDGAKPDAQTQISKAVAEIRKANPTMSERDAVIAAYEAHPEFKY